MHGLARPCLGKCIFHLVFARMPQTKNENKALAKLYIVLTGFLAQAKTVHFMHLRVKHFCPKSDPFFWDFCL